MTTKERLHRLIDELAGDQEASALEALESVLARGSQPRRGGRRLPASLGIGASGHSDTSDNVDAVLAEGFGRSA